MKFVATAAAAVLLLTLPLVLQRLIITYQICCFGKSSSVLVPLPSVIPMSSGLADVAVMVPLCAAAAVVTVCWRTSSGCCDGAVEMFLSVASSLLAAER